MSKNWNPKVTNYRANGEIFEPSETTVPRTVTAYYDFLASYIRKANAQNDLPKIEQKKTSTASPEKVSVEVIA